MRAAERSCTNLVSQGDEIIAPKAGCSVQWENIDDDIFGSLEYKYVLLTMRIDLFDCGCNNEPLDRVS